jgi:hypothetical protein
VDEPTLELLQRAQAQAAAPFLTLIYLTPGMFGPPKAPPFRAFCRECEPDSARAVCIRRRARARAPRRRRPRIRCIAASARDGPTTDPDPDPPISFTGNITAPGLTAAPAAAPARAALNPEGGRA